MRKEFPEITLEQYILGECDAATVAAIESSPEAMERIDALRKSDEEIRMRYPFNAVLPELAMEAENYKSDTQQPAVRKKRSRKVLNWLMPMAGTAAAALVGAALLFSPFANAPQSGMNADSAEVDPANPYNETTTAKGSGPVLLVYHNTGTSAELLNDDALLKEGDAIQLAYVANGKRFGAILSKDGRGYISQHYPIAGTESALLQNGGEILLQHSWELDDAPHYEIFYFISSDDSFELQALISAISIEDIQKALPENAELKTIRIRKEEL